MTTVLAGDRAEAVPPHYRWTAEEFCQALDAGAFENPERLELIHGRITDRMAQGSLHLSRRARIARRLRHVLEPRHYIIEECSIRIASDGVPVADVAALRGGEGDYDARLPTNSDVVLLVEVAVTTQDYDLGEKSLLYAQAGVADYWVALPEAGEMVVHREPTPEGYRDVTRVGEDGAVAPLAAPDAMLPVRELLGRPAGGGQL